MICPYCFFETIYIYIYIYIYTHTYFGGGGPNSSLLASEASRERGDSTIANCPGGNLSR